jgi:sulfite oxidase
MTAKRLRLLEEKGLSLMPLTKPLEIDLETDAEYDAEMERRGWRDPVE